MTTTEQKSISEHGTIDPDRALRIAHEDAVRVYRDLDDFRIQLALESDGWHVDYELKDETIQGGGPHYIIDCGNGEILNKRYEQ